MAIDLPVGLLKRNTATANGQDSGPENGEGGGREISFGEMLADPMVVSVLTLSLPDMDEASRVAQFEDLKEGLEAPEASSRLTAPETFKRGEDTGLAVSYSFPSGLIYERAFILMQRKLVRVDVLRWPAHPEAAPAGSARRISESVRSLET
ncbi:MAG: hypothetical protein A2289_02175 [Deltaproteobacteria bacterium RIFOXYA12_FULL_58_15]|nr:MAG: hypothetical protein A2289_02175 [Deltaproteobacteria bacterium RIFOXYA12_FULL_58_15]